MQNINRKGKILFDNLNNAITSGVILRPQIITINKC